MELVMKYIPELIIPSTSTTDDNSWDNFSPTTKESPTSTKEYRLIHLLMAAAEALSGDQKSPHLARVILVRLKELIPNNLPTSSNMERLSSHFTDALLSLLNNNPPQQPNPPSTEFLSALKSLHDMSPCVSFGHLTANQAILESIAGERRVHILDYDVAEGVQWASLIQSLDSKTSLRITAVAGAKEVGRRLSAFAASVGKNFSFRICRLAAVRVVKGEAMVVNCVVRASSAASSVESFLKGGAGFGARIFTVVEEERGEGMGRGFVGEFMGEVERYVAIWEGIEKGFPRQGRVREMVERVILKPRIAAAVTKAYEREEGGGVGGGGVVERCGEWMEGVGFERIGLSFFNVCQAELLLALFNDGYHVDRDGVNKIVLCWKARRLLSASVWGVPQRLGFAGGLGDESA